MTQSTIRALFWDIGGVLLSNGWDRDQRREVVTHFGLDAEDFQERHKMIVPELEIGRLSLDDYLTQTVFHQARDFSRADFVAAMEAQSVALPGTLELARELGEKWRMYALNNESRELNAFRRHAFDLDGPLLAFFSSCYLGLAKPNPAIYRTALDLAGVTGVQAVMVDDRLQNVEAARSVGMHAVQVTSAEQLRSALAALGVQ
ncbi:HAD family hydrolase [Deinococcus ruber]|uniref:Hydrolase n=1 Tax=Deinococcus ruber TaxID=1848197 RepID=A0A918F232_9DEIO|nr:HAD family phosphatase [Deinococcus ruber]GGQ94312.1 hydrolase [Deinococcus ruber]